MAYCLYYSKIVHCNIFKNISSKYDEALKFYLYNYTKCTGNWFPVEIDSVDMNHIT